VNNTIITRRDFMKGAACAGMAATVGFPVELSLGDETVAKTKVVIIRDSTVLGGGGEIDSAVLSQMLDKGAAELFDRNDAASAWNRIFSPDDIVGVKSNKWPYLPTPPEMERAIRQRALKSGIHEDNISIDDRGVRENKIFKKATALINVRALKYHHWAGIGGCLKNYIMFVPRPEDYHDDSCADLGTIWKLPHIAGKTKLNILAMLTPLFHGIGPHHFDRKYVWEYKGIIVGTDPVAVDAVGLRIVEAKRMEHFGKYRPLAPPAHHIRFAETRHGVGTSDPDKIELIKLGWQDGVLI